jgi:hypothetical protein
MKNFLIAASIAALALASASPSFAAQSPYATGENGTAGTPLPAGTPSATPAVYAPTLDAPYEGPSYFSPGAGFGG